MFRKQLLRWVIAAVALGCLAPWVVRGLDVERLGGTEAAIAGSMVVKERLDCIEAMVRSVVSSGDEFYVGTGEEFWRQRILEFAFPDGRAVRDRSEADLLLSVGPSSDHGNCGGLSLIVEQVR